MNGAQDVGGMMSFGPVVAEPEEPLFHAEWEKRVLAMVVTCGALGVWNLDMVRLARESLHPSVYWSSSYYEIWFLALIKMVQLNGLVASRELQAGAAIREAKPGIRALSAERMLDVLARGTPYDRPASAPPLFDVGESVKVRNLPSYGHTRLPGYARGKLGVIDAWRGCFVFPDTNSRQRGENPQHCYTVRFTGAELWGPIGDPNLEVSIDAFESYLDRA